MTKVRGQEVLNSKKRLLSFVQKDKKTKCWNWTGATKKFGYGYLIVGSRTDGSRKTVTAHRYAFSIFNEMEIPKGEWVLHKCDNPSCINPKHLYLGNRSQNVKDREERGRNKVPNLKHENHPNSKLNWEKVNYIRTSYKKRGDVYRLAKKFSVDHHTVSDILRMKTWVPEPPKVKP